MKHLVSVIALGLLALLPAIGQEAPRPYATARDYAKWEKEVAAYEEADRQDPPPKGGIVFLGSSTIRLWKTLANAYGLSWRSRAGRWFSSTGCPNRTRGDGC
jgi:hypothetical protein